MLRPVRPVIWIIAICILLSVDRVVYSVLDNAEEEIGLGDWLDPFILVLLLWQALSLAVVAFFPILIAFTLLKFDILRLPRGLSDAICGGLAAALTCLAFWAFDPFLENQLRMVFNPDREISYILSYFYARFTEAVGWGIVGLPLGLLFWVLVGRPQKSAAA